MSSTHGNDHHGPLKLNLTDEERESAREVIATLLGEADDLGGGVLARVWRAEAEELRHLCVPTSDGAVIPCASCAEPADDIDERGLARCAACAEGGES
jgi:hypothetical protein